MARVRVGERPPRRAAPGRTRQVARSRVGRRRPTPRLIDLQRRVGNAAGGPVTARKSVQHDLASFVHWIGVVEMAYGPDKQAILQRLRRLYYSSYSGKAGAKFDQAIAGQAGAGSGPPLDMLHIGASTLDMLFETDTVRTLTGDILDPAHILAAIDVRLSGVTTKAGVAEAAYDAPWTGIVTWTGDLASWFVEWSQQIRAEMAKPPPRRAASSWRPVPRTPSSKRSATPAAVHRPGHQRCLEPGWHLPGTHP